MKQIIYRIVIWCMILSTINGCMSKRTQLITKETKQINKVSFVAVGDNLMHKQLIEEAYNGQSYDFFFYYHHIQSDIKKADLAFVNQETILAGQAKGYSGYPLFNTPDEMAETLHKVGFDIVNGATNHAFDQGEEGIRHSLEVFQRYKDMYYIGLHRSQSDFDHITVIHKNGIQIAFLSYNQYTNGNKVPNDFTYRHFDKEQMKKDVENAKKVSDVIVVSCHWGQEYDHEPNDFQKEYAKYLSSLGVDVILGTHSHTLQSVEWIENQNGHRTLVAYSLGNLISGMIERETQLGGMLSFDIIKKNDCISIENVILIPIVNHYQSYQKNDLLHSRYGFTVYRLKDYTENLASKHALNGYKGMKITKKDFVQIVNERIDHGIKIDI